jgi:hypothetical protein
MSALNKLFSCSIALAVNLLAVNLLILRCEAIALLRAD